MTAHKFGGSWTDDKLTRLRKYLEAYTRIFTKNERAQFYRTTYLDAFAGTGSRVDSEKPGDSETESLFELASDPDASAFKNGSARIALEVNPRFDQYVFVEQSARRVSELKKLQ